MNHVGLLSLEDLYSRATRSGAPSTNKFESVGKVSEGSNHVEKALDSRF